MSAARPEITAPPTQSAFDAMGEEAGRTLDLTVLMTVGGVAILLLVVAFAAIALFGAPASRRWLGTDRSVAIWGIGFPVIVLTALLAWGFAGLRAGESLTREEPALTIEVTGLQWWWRVVYVLPDGRRVESANEVRMPAGETTRFELDSADVIHSFWMPAHAGKLDMIPGRTTVMHVRPLETGESGGQCTEYCGGAHALMSFRVVVMEPDAFDAWLEAEAGPAALVDHPGAAVFADAGCGACHAVRGTDAPGGPGPDLTHIGGRRTLGAGLMPVNTATLEAWLADHQAIKPENHMPEFDFLTDEERQAIAAWLAELEPAE